jgi:hypothetical protein
MLHVRLTALVLALAATLPGCNGNDSPKDAAVEAMADLPGKELTKADLPGPDGPAIVPKIKSILPSSGFADKQTPVTIVGENFMAGMAVYIDGEPLHGAITVPSSATASFLMPRHPEVGDPTPYAVYVRVLVNNRTSNEVKFRYILPTPMTDGFRGVIITKSVEAMRYIASPVIEGKVKDDTGGSGVEAEVGYGPVGSDASTDNSWRWLPVPFSRSEAGYSIYGGSVRFPAEGNFDLAFRFSKDGGLHWIFADLDDSDLTYNPAQAAKLKVTVPPPFYCLENADCAPYPVRAVCNVPQKTCVECLTENDCTANAYSFGPKCEAAKGICYCTDDGECAKNPNGALCNGKPKGYCGCKDEKNCLAPKTCVESPPKSGIMVCS